MAIACDGYGMEEKALKLFEPRGDGKLWCGA
jgi:hypothetical protein